MQKHDVRVLRCNLENVRIEVAEGRREHHLGAIQIDHALHRLLHGDGLRHVFLIHGLDPGLPGNGRLAFEMRLIVAVVVTRADVDEAHHHFFGCEGHFADAQSPGQDPNSRSGQGFQHRAAALIDGFACFFVHSLSPHGCRYMVHLIIACGMSSSTPLTPNLLRQI